MAYYSPPLINTTDTNFGIDNTTIEPVVDPYATQVRRTVLAVQEIPYTQNSYERVGYVDPPAPPRHRGWSMPQVDWPYLQVYQPLSAPPVHRSGGAYSAQILAAAKPPATYSQTGYTLPLRAPGINEGY